MGDDEAKTPAPDDQGDVTTLHVQRAARGDGESLTWLVNRFTPVLFSQARYRLGRNFRSVYDPEDLVNDVWAIALPKLAELPTRDGRLTPVVMKFLSTTLLYRFNTLVRRRIKGPTRVEGQEDGAHDPMQQFAEQTRGVVTRVIGSEERRQVSDAIDALNDTDREILILRGVEQNPIPFIAAQLELTENAVYARYHRALKNLRERIGSSVFEEFVER